MVAELFIFIFFMCDKESATKTTKFLVFINLLGFNTNSLDYLGEYVEIFLSQMYPQSPENKDAMSIPTFA